MTRIKYEVKLKHTEKKCITVLFDILMGLSIIIFEVFLNIKCSRLCILLINKQLNHITTQEYIIRVHHGGDAQGQE